MTNQLVSEQAALLDLSEFDGMSVRDIAFTITLSEEGGEDQLRAIEAIRRRAPGIGHNRPPLAERLDDDFSALRARATELLRVTGTVRVVDDDSAAKVVDLIRQASTIEADVDALRKALLKPYDDAARLISERAAAIKDPVQIARQGQPGDKGRGGLRRLITEHDDRKRREADEARQRLLEEQRQREAEAEAARRRAEEQATAGRSSVVADLAAADAQAEAQRAADRAAAIRPEPIRSNLGQTTRRRVISYEITDIRKYLGALLKDRVYAPRLREFAETTAAAQGRALGVDAIDRGIQYPGIEFKTALGDVNVRR